MDFFSKTTDDVFTFEIDDSRRVTRMMLHTGCEKIPLHRFDEYVCTTPAPDERI